MSSYKCSSDLHCDTNDINCTYFDKDLVKQSEVIQKSMNSTQNGGGVKRPLEVSQESEAKKQRSNDPSTSQKLDLSHNNECEDENELFCSYFDDHLVKLCEETEKW